MSHEISIKRTQNSKIADIDFNNLPFGKVFTDHMFVADYKDGQWKNMQIIPFQNLSLHPATSALHYGQAIFEGMKATKDKDGNILVFRPDANAVRLNHSAERMAMQELPDGLLIEALDLLLKLDADWIPTDENSSLYIRPFMFATDEYVGIKESDTYKFMIFCSPVGAYYSAPVKVEITDKFVRAFPGGTGFAKAAGNYAATLYPLRAVRDKGYHQILWLDGIEHRYFQEIGTMNVFFQINDKLITPDLKENTILHGITRDSIIQLAKANNISVEERPISIDEFLEAHANGSLIEAFGTGTAATVANISHISYKDKEYAISVDNPNAFSSELKNQLSDIKHGVLPDKFGWIRTIKA